MSRKGFKEGSITLHPSKTEASIGKKETLELAVMIDTFKPLKTVKKAKDIEDTNYMYTWLE